MLTHEYLILYLMTRVLISLIWTNSSVSAVAITKEIHDTLRIQAVYQSPGTPWGASQKHSWPRVIHRLRHVLPDHEKIRGGSRLMMKWQPNIVTPKQVPWRGKDWWGRSYQEGLLEEAGTWVKPPRRSRTFIWEVEEQRSKVLRARWAAQSQSRVDST